MPKHVYLFLDHLSAASPTVLVDVVCSGPTDCPGDKEELSELEAVPEFSLTKCLTDKFEASNPSLERTFSFETTSSPSTLIKAPEHLKCCIAKDAGTAWILHPSQLKPVARKEDGLRDWELPRSPMVQMMKMTRISTLLRALYPHLPPVCATLRPQPRKKDVRYIVHYPSLVNRSSSFCNVFVADPACFFPQLGGLQMPTLGTANRGFRADHLRRSKDCHQRNSNRTSTPTRLSKSE